MKAIERSETGYFGRERTKGGLFVGVILLLSVAFYVKAEDFYDVPRTPPENKSRLKIRHTGVMLLGQLFLDGKPFAYFGLEEMSGNPLVFWLTKDKFAFLGCDGPHSCDTWRIGQLSTKTYSDMKLSGFESGLSRPVFQPPYVGYRGRLPNGNIGCIVYDWNKEKYVIRWDSGSAALEGLAIRFDQNGTSVSCAIIDGWSLNPHYEESGRDSPEYLPVYGKSHTERLASEND